MAPNNNDSRIAVLETKVEDHKESINKLEAHMSSKFNDIEKLLLVMRQESQDGFKAIREEYVKKDDLNGVKKFLFILTCVVVIGLIMSVILKTFPGFVFFKG